MRWVGFAVFVLSTVLWTGALVQPASATSCATDAQCSSDTTCQPALIPGTKECKEQRCNFNSDCPTDRGNCLGGACRAPAGSTGGAPTGGISLSGEGQACGPRKFGQVTKSVPCKRGLQCTRGICRKPLS